MANFNFGWYVLYTRPNRERKIALYLDRKSLNFYLPTVKVSKKWADRKRIVESPLFSSYIFVYLNSFEDYFSSLEADGAVEYIRFGKQLARIDESVIRNLRILVDAKEELYLCRDSIATGAPLRITDGPLAGLECEMVKYNGKDKILVRISLLNRMVLADVPVGSLVRSGQIY
jgi:transcriptional antiterminator RfaH